VNLANTLRSRRELVRAESIYRAINTSPRASQISMSNHAGVLNTMGKPEAAESLYRELAKRFPQARVAQTYPAVFIYERGQYDSLDAFWKPKTLDANPLVKIGALSTMTSLALLRGHIKDGVQVAAQMRAANAARGVPDNPIADSLTSAQIAIWFFGQNERGIRALDAAVARVPFKTLPIEQRPYVTFATYYALGGRPDKARAMLVQFDADISDPQLKRLFEPARHSVLAEILMAEKKPLEAVREIWKSDTLADGPSSDCAHCLDFDLGRAYDLANLPDSTIMHWERYLAESFNRSPGRDAAVLAGVHKRLGEIYEAKGDLAKAESHFTEFVSLWKTADPELQPKVAEVNRRLAAIRAKKSG
jgi:tetratricopeptide (TPR) repeat protein